MSTSENVNPAEQNIVRDFFCVLWKRVVNPICIIVIMDKFQIEVERREHYHFFNYYIIMHDHSDLYSVQFDFGKNLSCPCFGMTRASHQNVSKIP